MFSESLMKKIGLFAGGVLFGTAGVKLLSSKDAKEGLHRVYGSGAACKGLRDENRHDRTGECGGYLCGSPADQ